MVLPDPRRMLRPAGQNFSTHCHTTKPQIHLLPPPHTPGTQTHTYTHETRTYTHEARTPTTTKNQLKLTQREEFQSLCRVMSGLSDDFYKQTTAFYQDGRILDGPKPYYRTGGCFWECKCVRECGRARLCFGERGLLIRPHGHPQHTPPKQGPSRTLTYPQNKNQPNTPLHPHTHNRGGATHLAGALPGVGGARRGAHRLARPQGKLKTQNPWWSNSGGLGWIGLGGGG